MSSKSQVNILIPASWLNKHPWTRWQGETHVYQRNGLAYHTCAQTITYLKLGNVAKLFQKAQEVQAHYITQIHIKGFLNKYYPWECQSGIVIFFFPPNNKTWHTRQTNHIRLTTTCGFSVKLHSLETHRQTLNHQITDNLDREVPGSFTPTSTFTIASFVRLTWFHVEEKREKSISLCVERWLIHLLHSHLADLIAAGLEDCMGHSSLPETLFIAAWRLNQISMS